MFDSWGTNEGEKPEKQHPHLFDLFLVVSLGVRFF